MYLRHTSRRLSISHPPFFLSFFFHQPLRIRMQISINERHRKYLTIWTTGYFLIMLGILAHVHRAVRIPVENNKLTNCNEHRLANNSGFRVRRESENLSTRRYYPQRASRSKSRTLRTLKQIVHSDQVDSTVNIAILTCLNCSKLLEIRISYAEML